MCVATNELGLGEKLAGLPAGGWCRKLELVCCLINGSQDMGAAGAVCCERCRRSSFSGVHLAIYAFQLLVGEIVFNCIKKTLFVSGAREKSDS